MVKLKIKLSTLERIVPNLYFYWSSEMSSTTLNRSSCFGIKVEDRLMIGTYVVETVCTSPPGTIWDVTEQFGRRAICARLK